MAVTKWVTEEPDTYQYLSVKILDEKGNDITANINGKVLYSGVEYSLYILDSIENSNIISLLIIFITKIYISIIVSREFNL